MFSIEETGFEGLKLLHTNNFHDGRGAFRKIFSSDEFQSLSLRTDFKEFYYSINKKNVIRGMHFQTPPADHTKLVYVVNGSIIDVVLDIRKRSKTFGKWFSCKLTGEDSAYLYIPEGFAHGFKSLEDGAVVHYAQTSCYSKENDSGIKYDSFGYDWNVHNPIVSERDLSHPSFSSYNTPF